MSTKIFAALASSFVVVLALVFVEPAGAYEAHDGHHYQNHKQATKRTRRAASRARHKTKANRKASRRAVSYVCPMHPDIREESRGVCPKCLMDLVAEPRRAKADRNVKDNAGGAGAG